jgi:hypothetical protein
MQDDIYIETVRPVSCGLLASVTSATNASIGQRHGYNGGIDVAHRYHRVEVTALKAVDDLQIRQTKPVYNTVPVIPIPIRESEPCRCTPF